MQATGSISAGYILLIVLAAFRLSIYLFIIYFIFIYLFTIYYLFIYLLINLFIYSIYLVTANRLQSTLLFSWQVNPQYFGVRSTPVNTLNSLTASNTQAAVTFCVFLPTMDNLIKLPRSAGLFTAPWRTLEPPGCWLGRVRRQAPGPL